MNRLQREDGATLAFQVHNPKAPGVPLFSHTVSAPPRACGTRMSMP